MACFFYCKKFRSLATGRTGHKRNCYFSPLIPEEYMAEIKNLVFDLGNVIIDIDYAVTINEFQKIAAVDFGEILSYSKQLNLFDDFERGSISAAQFRNELRKFLKPGTSDEAIDHAWNAILRHYPPAKFEMLRQLKNRYQVYALSNINEIHVDTVQTDIARQFGEPGVHAFFNKMYYSNQLGARKPERKIYELLLQRENLNPEETFFVDDKVENVAVAKQLGMQAWHLADREKLFELLGGVQII